MAETIMNMQNNIIDFEKREMKPFDNVVALTQSSALEGAQPFASNGTAENGSGNCENGVCVLAWKPRRPTAVA